QGLVFVVTGGCGFLGSHLVRLLLQEEPELRELRVFDLHPDPSVIPPGQGRARPTLGGQLWGWDPQMWGTGGHGGYMGLGRVDVWGRSSPQAMARVNVQGTKNVIRGCVAGGVSCLIFTSSMEVLGPNSRQDPFFRGDEDTPYPVRHCEPYPLGKAQAERLVLEANGSPVAGGGRLLTLSLRPTGIYGEGHPLLPLFYQQGRAAGGWLPRTLPPHAEHGRVYVGNVAWMHVVASRRARLAPSSVAGDYFFCYDGSPRAPYDQFTALLLGLRFGGPLRPPRPLLALLAWLNQLLGPLYRALGVAAPLLNPYTLAVASTPFSLQTSKAQRCFGYQPQFDWDEARDRTQRWLRGVFG
ncbi:3BHS7 dehydrogenase, partial [Rhinopomastus cyanomelas]|nr:3BHS7 dehydrogenase [Rhinopomastus cyanomelas]